MKRLLLLCAFMSAGAFAEVLPSYPVGAARMSLEGFTTVRIDCDTKNVDVVHDSSDVGYFSKQVGRQVHQLCVGQRGVLERTYIFKMNKRIGSHDMLVIQSGRVL